MRAYGRSARFTKSRRISRETVWVDGIPVLTHQGLYNIARSVIRQFVAQAPKVEQEPYDYTFEQSNVVRGEMAAQYWVGKPLGSPSQGRKRIEGILSQIEGLVRKSDKPILTDIRPIADQVLGYAEVSRGRVRQDLLTFLALFNAVVSNDEHLDDWDAIYERHSTAIRKLSETSVAVTPLFGVPEEWSLEDHYKYLNSYFRQRVKRNG